MNSLCLKNDQVITKLIREKISLDDIKRYMLTNKVFTQAEMPWADFFWRIGIENAMVLLTEERLKNHFGYMGIRAVNDFAKYRLVNKTQGIDYFKVGRENILVQEYLIANPHIKSKVFYLLSATCYSLCLIDANTEESRAADTYMVKMNFIAVKMVTSLLINTVDELKMLNINVNDELIASNIDLESSNNKLESSDNMIEKMNLKYEKDLANSLQREEDLQIRYDRLMEKYDKLLEKYNAIHCRSSKNISTVLPGDSDMSKAFKALIPSVGMNTFSAKMEELVQLTYSSCSLGDNMVNRHIRGILALDIEIPDREIRLVTPSYARNAYEKMKICILDKKSVSQEVFSIVEKSSKFADALVARYGMEGLKAFGSGISYARSMNPKYGQEMFEKLVKTTKLKIASQQNAKPIMVEAQNKAPTSSSEEEDEEDDEDSDIDAL